MNQLGHMVRRFSTRSKGVGRRVILTGECYAERSPPALFHVSGCRSVQPGERIVLQPRHDWRRNRNEEASRSIPFSFYIESLNHCRLVTISQAASNVEREIASVKSHPPRLPYASGALVVTGTMVGPWETTNASLAAENPAPLVSILFRIGNFTRCNSTKSTPSAVSAKSELSARVM